jgi:hypothetical protein
MTVLLAHYIHSNVKKVQEQKQKEEAKKNDDLQKMKKADMMAVKSKQLKSQKHSGTRKKDFKTNERRNHHPTAHHIQQPSKY